MVRRTTVLAALAAGVAAALPAPSAGAATEHRVVSVALRFLPTELTIAVGDSIVLTNLESAPHNLVARDVGPDGRAYFSSATIGLAESAAVLGVSALEPSDYPFLCTVHPEMTGVLLVR